MADIKSEHTPADLAHHVRQGAAWLSVSAGGNNTAMLSYAAFEFRFAIERLAIHYWRVLLDRKLEERDLSDIRSFKTIENRIYELGGHQKEINAHFEFMRIIIDLLQVGIPLKTPAIGQLSSYWHTCSELCHIAWPLASTVEEERSKAFSKLTDISQVLKEMVTSLGWPVIRDPGFAELRDRYVAGSATRDEVLAYVHRTGAKAEAEFSDGSIKRFAHAVPPIEQPES